MTGSNIDKLIGPATPEDNAEVRHAIAAEQDVEAIRQIDLEMTITRIEPYPPKKMDFGAVTVCSKCGNGHIPYVGEDYKACCEGATLISLRKYTEEVKKIPFDNSEWHFEEKEPLKNF